MSSEVAIPERKAAPFGWIALVFAVLFAVGAMIVFAMHRSFVAADRVVAHHVPADAAAVLRVDLEKATLFAPIRRCLMPLLDQTQPPPGKARWERLADHSSLVLGRDTREGLILWGRDANDWALVLGGNYPAGALGALSEVFREEGTPWQEGPEQLVSPSGAAVAQAGDRALLLASSPKRLGTLLPSTSEHLRLGVPLKGALSFVGEPRSVPWLGQALGPLGDVTRVTAAADWSSPLIVQLKLTYGSAPPAGVAALVQQRWRALVGDEEAKRLERLVGLPTVEVDGNLVGVTTSWDSDGLERLAERLAAALAPGLPPPPRLE